MYMYLLLLFFVIIVVVYCLQIEQFQSNETKFKQKLKNVKDKFTEMKHATQKEMVTIATREIACKESLVGSMDNGHLNALISLIFLYIVLIKEVSLLKKCPY